MIHVQTTVVKPHYWKVILGRMKNSNFPFPNSVMASHCDHHLESILSICLLHSEDQWPSLHISTQISTQWPSRGVLTTLWQSPGLGEPGTQLHDILPFTIYLSDQPPGSLYITVPHHIMHTDVLSWLTKCINHRSNQVIQGTPCKISLFIQGPFLIHRRTL